MNFPINLFDALLRADAQQRAGRQAKTKRGNEAQHQRTSNNLAYCRKLIDVAADHNRLAVVKPTPHGASYLCSPTHQVDANQRSILRVPVRAQAGWDVLDVAYHAFAVRVEQTGKLHTTWIFPQIVVDCLRLLFRCGARKCFCVVTN